MNLVYLLFSYLLIVNFFLFLGNIAPRWFFCYSCIMPKFYKILIILVFLVVSAFFLLHFFPSVKRELKIENPPDKDAAISQESIENNENDVKDKKEIASDNQVVTSPEKTEKNNKSESVDNKSGIIQKLVGWGYTASSKPRSIDTIIIHSSYNALSNNPYDLNKLIEEYKSYGVAPHYLIDRNGKIYQLVSDQNIAYHAGESQMPDGRTNVNNFSLGIEIMTTEKDSPTDSQYQSLNELIKYIKQKYSIKNILGHNQISPGRKTDPWNFNWDKIK
jgi:hypothetical protein